MLDLFTIFSKGGIVLWYFQGTAQLFTNSVNELIKTIILQERGVSSAWNHENLSLQYKLDNEFELVFVVAYQNILKLGYIDKLLSEIQLKFRDRYKNVLQHSNMGPFDMTMGAGFGDCDFASFDNDFNIILKQCEMEARQLTAGGAKPRRFNETDKANRTVSSMVEKKTGVITNLLSMGTKTTKDTEPTLKKNKKKSNKNKEVVEEEEEEQEEAEVVKEEEETLGTTDQLIIPSSPSTGPRQMRKFDKNKKTPNTESPKSTAVKKGKTGTKWDNSDDKQVLDYGDNVDKIGESAVNSQYATREDIGKMKGDLKGLEISPVVEQQQPLTTKTTTTTKKSSNNSGGSGLFSSLKSLVGSKILTADMIEPVMAKMQEHLVTKNVAMEIAQKICSNVAQNLEGKQMGSFQFVTSLVKTALSDSIVQILTPKKRVDILRDVYESRRARKPYVIVFCGVNGVGKSTNLAKVTFWLIENSFRVLIAACDTFRSGAVEQLRTHSRHLNALHPVKDGDKKQMVELYEKGYGKDAAAIAHEAINYARDQQHDVVLVDTAGRMQDNEPLMKALAKLININNPDLVLFVGEALVGNEAVDQVRKFNQALIDNSNLKTATTADKARTIDGIVLTKFDTIDDKVGAAVSMTYITGQPIVFVGTGQTYSDLKNLNAESVVQSLLK